MRVARGGQGSRPPSSSSKVQNLGLKLVFCEGIIALKTVKFSRAYRCNQKPSENYIFWPYVVENVDFYMPVARPFCGGGMVSP